MPIIKQFIRSGINYDPPSSIEDNVEDIHPDVQVYHIYKQRNFDHVNYEFMKSLIKFFRARIHDKEIMKAIKLDAEDFFRYSDELLNIIDNNIQVLNQNPKKSQRRDSINPYNKLYKKSLEKNKQYNERIRNIEQKEFQANNRKLTIQELGKLSKKERKAYYAQQIKEDNFKRIKRELNEDSSI